MASWPQRRVGHPDVSMIIVMPAVVILTLAECGEQAIDQRGLLGGRQPCLGMSGQVEPGRHFSIPDHLGGLVAVVLTTSPFGDVEMRTPLVDVALYEPRSRRDLAVPRPSRFVAVAVSAGPEEERTRRRAIPIGLTDDRRILVASSVRNELDE